MMLLAMFSLGACEKAVLDEQEDTQSTEGNVIIRATLYEIVPFDTRAVQNIADYCSTLQFAVFQDGTKVKGITQKKGSDGYGQVHFSLEPGTYQLLVLAHSSTGSPSINDPSKIQFTNSDGYSDTFFYYDNLTVTEGENVQEARLQRASSMVRITITDNIPANVSTIRLYYEGESGVFNAVTGWGGTVNSKQSITYNVQGQSSPLTLAAYTFLRNEEGTLNMTLTAYDANSGVVAEKELKNIPMKNHMVTEYSGKLFSATGTNISMSFTADTAWQVYRQLTF